MTWLLLLQLALGLACLWFAAQSARKAYAATSSYLRKHEAWDAVFYLVLGLANFWTASR